MRACGREGPKRDDVEYVRSPTLYLLRTSIKTWRTSISEKATLFSIAQVQLIFFILNLAKLPRFEVNYDFIKSANGEKATLCLQTRIAFAMISKKDFYQNMFHKTLFDTSFFLIHFLFSITSAKVLGKIKDDCRGKPVEEFIGLRSMLNSFFNDDMEKTVKGVKHICN